MITANKTQRSLSSLLHNDEIPLNKTDTVHMSHVSAKPSGMTFFVRIAPVCSTLPSRLTTHFVLLYCEGGNPTEPIEEKLKAAACGDPDEKIDDDEMEQEEMFVDAHESFEHKMVEWGGPRRGGRFPEPTRFGDWERKGRCTDF